MWFLTYWAEHQLAIWNWTPTRRPNRSSAPKSAATRSAHTLSSPLPRWFSPQRTIAVSSPFWRCCYGAAGAPILRRVGAATGKLSWAAGKWSWAAERLRWAGECRWGIVGKELGAVGEGMVARYIKDGHHLRNNVKLLISKSGNKFKILEQKLLFNYVLSISHDWQTLAINFLFCFDSMKLW